MRAPGDAGHGSELIGDLSSRAAFVAIRTVAIAETLRLIPPFSTEGGITRDQVEEAVAQLARLGIGRYTAAWPSFTAAEVARRGGDLLEAIEQSPLPQQEWEPIQDLLGDELLSRLLSISSSSLTRYRGGERRTPDEVADRLHAITLVCSDLAGSYNDFGIRRWFIRPRLLLDGKAPADLLTGSWSSDDPQVRKVRELATSLLGSPAA